MNEIAEEIEHKVNNYLRDNRGHDTEHIIIIGNKEYYSIMSNHINYSSSIEDKTIFGIKYKRVPLESTFSIMRVDSYKAICASVRRDMMDGMNRINLLSEQV